MYIYIHDRSSQKSEQVDCVELEEQVIVNHSVIAGN